MTNFDIKDLKEDRKLILKYIIDTYVELGEAVGSEMLVKKYNLKMSSAKVRYVMSDLEEKGYLIKNHVSSGRIPSNKGYAYYAKYLVEYNEDFLKEKLKDLFAKRRANIDVILDEAAKRVSEMMGITLVTSKTNEEDTLKSIQLVPLTEYEATIVLVVSSGEVVSKKIEVDPSLINLNDLKVAIRIFKERLIDTPIVELGNTAKNLIPFLAAGIKNYETLLQNFVQNVFNFEVVNQNKVYGKDQIILASDIKRPDLIKILELIENKSIWETIESEFNEDDTNIKISIREDNSAFISKKISYDNKIKEIAVVGTNRMNYNQSLAAIQMLEDLINNKNENKKEK
ncbi:heat-inducible transcriptional repressor HrcA [Mycoplasmopsis columbina]|uniref:heat-inducible transcriptional repressor HrcA n=1 Tax=Mycoplasmopsis columbina TaxID=114881 RepID=UPI0004A6EE22|nr:heat-inducible transcriptional repressor HrcA [Mycoplasmopsis columbina]VEU77037.1 heat inducible transcription repressor HrcA [Mycoplasmopsis columbina]